MFKNNFNYILSQQSTHNGFLFYSPKRKKRTEKFLLASPICLPFSASTSHVLGTCAVEKVRGVLSVTEWDKQQLLSPSGKPRGIESS